MNAAKFISAFQHLRQDAIPGRWRPETMHVAPHKPLLLITVIDQFLVSPTSSRLIEPGLALEMRFDDYWEAIGETHRTTMALPFFHLRSDGFWRLVPMPGMEDALAAPVEPTRSAAALRKLVKGAELDSDLYLLLTDPAWAHHLRSVLLTSHFTPELQSWLVNRNGSTWQGSLAAHSNGSE